MSRSLARTIDTLGNALTFWQSPFRRRKTKAHLAERLQQYVHVPVQGTELVFFCPTSRSLNDPMKFHEEEPETLNWIDTYIQEGDIFWDVGANIGMYAIYANKTKGAKAYAFEPSAQTFAVLDKNIILNKCPFVAAYNVALSNRTFSDFLYMENTEAGHAKHAFGTDTSSIGKIKTIYKQTCLGFKAEDFANHFNIPFPDHLKLDVDGNELDVLQGMGTHLKQIKSLIIEIMDEEDPNAKAIEDYLNKAGFKAQDMSAYPQSRNTVFTHW